jgi:ribosome biogenesis protein MAK21
MTNARNEVYPKGQKHSQPGFNAAALSKLTAKIDATLPKAQEERPEKRKRTDGEGKDSNPNKRHAHGSRDRRPNNSKKPSKEQPFSLLEEIKALGGDEADLELVAGIDSDAEDGQQPAAGTASTDVGKAFLSELSKFASTLGFDEVRDEVVVTDDEPEDGDQGGDTVANGEGDEDEDEWEEEEEEEEDEDEEPAPAPVPAPPQPTEKEKAQSRKAAAKLVSMQHLIMFCQRQELTLILDVRTSA